MKQWFAALSRAQKRTLYLATAGLIIITTLSVVIKPAAKKLDPKSFNTGHTIKQMAPRLGVTGMALAKELKIPISSPKNKPVRDMGVTPERLDHAVKHLLSHRDSMGKYFIYAAFLIYGLIFLLFLGRPHGSPVAKRKEWYPRLPYILILLVSVIITGFVMGKSPNPMEGIVKVFKAMVGLYPNPISKILAFLFFSLLVVTGNKFICGWGCPLGALQELIYSIPGLKKIKFKLPFWLTNGLRVLLFGAMLLLLFGIIGGKRGFVVYHFLNAFDLFGFAFDTPSILIASIATVVLALVLYRPFCTLICPFGLISWVLERVSFFKVRINHEACIDCGACSRACPTHAAHHKVHKALMPADCFSCGRCLNTCPTEALKYKKP